MSIATPPTTPSPAQAHRKNREIVLQTIIDLCEHNQGASRSRIVELTGLKMTTVDEQVDWLKTNGLVRALMPGLFEPIDQTDDRLVSTTSLPRGRLKVEVGDEVLTLTPREALALAKQMAGVLLAFRVG